MIQSADTHWLAKMLVDQGATDRTCSNMPKGIVAKSAIPSSVPEAAYSVTYQRDQIRHDYNRMKNDYKVI